MSEFWRFLGLEPYLPNIWLTIPFIAFNIGRFENQRWLRAQDEKVGDPANRTFLEKNETAALIFSLLFLVAYSYDSSFIHMTLLVLITILIGVAYAIISNWAFGATNHLAWKIGTYSIWPIALVLIASVSWFGLF